MRTTQNTFKSPCMYQSEDISWQIKISYTRPANTHSWHIIVTKITETYACVLNVETRCVFQLESAWRDDVCECTLSFVGYVFILYEHIGMRRSVYLCRDYREMTRSFYHFVLRISRVFVWLAYAMGSNRVTLKRKQPYRVRDRMVSKTIF